MRSAWYRRAVLTWLPVTISTPQRRVPSHGCSSYERRRHRHWTSAAPAASHVDRHQCRTVATDLRPTRWGGRPRVPAAQRSTAPASHRQYCSVRRCSAAGERRRRSRPCQPRWILHTQKGVPVIYNSVNIHTCYCLYYIYDYMLT